MRPMVRCGNLGEGRASPSTAAIQSNTQLHSAISRWPFTHPRSSIGRSCPGQGRVGKSGKVLCRCARAGFRSSRAMASTRTLAQSSRKKHGSRVRLSPGGHASIGLERIRRVDGAVQPTSREGISVCMVGFLPKRWNCPPDRGRVGGGRKPILGGTGKCHNLRSRRAVTRRFGRTG